MKTFFKFAIDYRGTGALSGRIEDPAGNVVDASLPPPGSPGSLSASHDVLLDHAARA